LVTIFNSMTRSRSQPRDRPLDRFLAKSVFRKLCLYVFVARKCIACEFVVEQWRTVTGEPYYCACVYEGAYVIIFVTRI
jgi:hypothetical protein